MTFLSAYFIVSGTIAAFVTPVFGAAAMPLITFHSDTVINAFKVVLGC